MVHGKQPNDIRDTNMQRFRTNDTQIMVATTVIEVGVDVPNASVMIIESAEKIWPFPITPAKRKSRKRFRKKFLHFVNGK